MSDNSSSSGPKIVNRKDFEAKIVAQAWRDPKYKQRLLKDPKAVVQEELENLQAGVELPDDLKVAVHEESPQHYHFVLPRNPNDVAPGAVSSEQFEAIAPQTIAVVVVANVAVSTVTSQAVITGPAVNVVTSYVNQVVAQVNVVANTNAIA